LLTKGKKGEKTFLFFSTRRRNRVYHLIQGKKEKPRGERGGACKAVPGKKKRETIVHSLTSKRGGEGRGESLRGGEGKKRGGEASASFFLGEEKKEEKEKRRFLLPKGRKVKDLKSGKDFSHYLSE